MNISNDQFPKAIDIAETYFLSTLQKVVSGAVYHCKKPNIGDIPNKEAVHRYILRFVWEDLENFMKE